MVFGEICWKCNRMITDRSGNEGCCRDCSVADTQWIRYRRLFKIIDFYDPRYNCAFDYEKWGKKIDATKGVCPKCNKFVGRLSMDHIVAFIEGGSPLESNCQPMCRSCNSKKEIERRRLKNKALTNNNDSVNIPNMKAKAKASRENGRKGGRPKVIKEKELEVEHGKFSDKLLRPINLVIHHEK